MTARLSVVTVRVIFTHALGKQLSQNIWEQAVDTTEELNDTYFYAGRQNLTASELFFIIFCEEVAERLGIDDFGAIVAVCSG